MKGASRHRTSTRGLAHTAPVFAALGDETRLALVVRLGSAGPHSIAQLAAESHLTRQAITKHLEVLGDAGLVRSERRGRERIWNFEAAELEEARQFLDDVSSQWDAALARLQKFVEK
ncbi:MAG: metalloregulator ArsR/SmtB family transcription factor [Vicinamibacterales bacterium]